MTIKLGFVGIGRMGAPMARRLLAAGYALTVYDPSETAVSDLVAAGAKGASNPAGVANAAEIVFLSLPTPDIVNAVATGPDGLTSGKGLRIVVDLSTTGPRGAKMLAQGLGANDIALIDCPVSGGVAGATNGKLTLMAAGSADAFSEVEPILSNFGKATHVGEEPGQAQLIKVINNLMSVTALGIASEGLVLAQKAGVDPAMFMQIVNSGSGRSNASEDKIPKYVLTRSFDFGFALGLSAKDVRLCLDEADALGVPMIIGSAARQLLTVAKGELGAEGDLTAMIKPIERWAGINLDEPEVDDR
ncbi:MAG: NAD(P)-dependent oxidoreductase [Rhizobiaceae bacterium]|nr:NAD(P)-dependent oxidoreductase [Rhizobiaceae bacterium]